MSRSSGRIVLALALALAPLAPPPASAVDGVIEINQARALAGGVTATDAPGFPVTLDSDGSYRLTGNLTVADKNKTVIEVSALATEVTIDLNGFSLLGPVVCDPACSPTGGVGNGITFLGGALHVRGGSIRGMGLDGVHSNGLAFLDRIAAYYNGRHGLYVASAASISGCVAGANGGNGIQAGTASVIVHNSVLSNNGEGIFTGSNSTVEGNTVTGNLSAGIETSAGSVILDNAVANNTGYGLHGTGISIGYARNVLDNNHGGNANPQVLNAIQIGANICGGDTTCP